MDKTEVVMLNNLREIISERDKHIKELEDEKVLILTHISAALEVLSDGSSVVTENQLRNNLRAIVDDYRRVD